MRLRVENSVIAFPEDGKISIERESPYWNESPGEFSYPFTVSTPANQKALGFPGRLSRKEDIPKQTFILDEGGYQVARGEVEYDDITREETGLLLKSGLTEFYQLVEKKKLTELDFGSEWWNPSRVIDKTNEWSAANTTSNGNYVCAPFIMKNEKGDTVPVNPTYWATAGNSTLKLNVANLHIAYEYSGMFCLQFRVYFVINKIFESQGYTVVVNEMASSVFADAILFGQAIAIYATTNGLSNINWKDKMEYGHLMPKVKVKEFLEYMAKMFFLGYDIDKNRKEVSIRFQKTIFGGNNLDLMLIKELEGWTHQETKEYKGIMLEYSGQDDQEDTKIPNCDDEEAKVPKADVTYASLPLPAVSKEHQICYVTSVDRYYVTVLDESADPPAFWKETGRLHGVGIGDLEEAEQFSININVPNQVARAETWSGVKITFEVPDMTNITREKEGFLTPIPLAVTLYRGRVGYTTIGGTVNIPIACFDRYSLDGTHDFTTSLKPGYLKTFHEEVLNWHLRKRGFTKHLQLPLKDVIRLQWSKRYKINGVQVIFNKINFDLPYRGSVEVEGYLD